MTKKTMTLTDEDIDGMRASMAEAPLGAIADAVWGVADDPANHEELIADLDGAIRTHIIGESATARLDEPQLVGLVERIVKALIAQHLFTGTITRCSCLSPVIDEPVAVPPALKWFAALRPE